MQPMREALVVNPPLRLHAFWAGHRIALARLAWLLLALGTFTPLLAGVSPFTAELHTACTDDACSGWRLSASGLQTLVDKQFTLDFLSAVAVGIQLVAATIWALIGGFLIWRRPTERMAQFSAVFLLTAGAALASGLQTAA